MPNKNGAAPSTDLELQMLTGEIKAAHAECSRHQQTAVDYAVKCGEMLLKAKELIEHGNSKKNPKAGWERYVERECGIPYRTAHRYFLIAKHRHLWATEEKSGTVESASVAEMGVVGLEVLIRKRLKLDELTRDHMFDPAESVLARELKAEKEIHDAMTRVTDRDRLLSQWWSLFEEIQVLYFGDQTGGRDVLETIRRNCDDFLNAPNDDEEDQAPITGGRSRASMVEAA
jgi:hypothetical protein